MKKIIVILIVITLVVSIAVGITLLTVSNEKHTELKQQPDLKERIGDDSNEIQLITNEFLEVTSPQPSEKFKDTVSVSGKSNFFNANTNIRIIDDNKEVLAETSTTAQGWMDNLYPFSKEVNLEKTPTMATGQVEIFGRSPQSEKESYKISIPIIFMQE